MRGLVPAASDFPLGDLYICWSPDAIYLAIYVTEIVEPDYYKDGKIPDADRAVWQIQLDGQAPLIVKLGAGKEVVANDRNVRTVSLSGVYHDVRSITAVAYPVTKLGKERFTAGDRIRLKGKFNAFGRAHQIDWDAELTLANIDVPSAE